jgi:hypothetical protein
MSKEVIYRGGKVLSGGLVGHYVATITKGVLNDFGAYVLLSAVFIISLMICTNISLGLVFSRISLWLGLFQRQVREFITKRKERK